MKKLSRQEHTFIHALLKGATKTDAYKRAFPGTKHETAATSGCKLSKQPHIIVRMEELESRASDNMGDEIVEDLTAHYMSLHEKRLLLTSMMRGEHKVNKFFKMKDDIKTLEDDVNPSVLLRAIELDTKIENGWYDRKALPAINTGQKQPPKPQPKPKPTRFAVYIDGKSLDTKLFPHLTRDEEKALRQLSLTHKDYIITREPTLTPKEIENGFRAVQIPQTGWYYAVTENISDEELEEILSEMDPFYAKAFDDEELANITNNSKVITGMLNCEYAICLYGDSNNTDKESEAEEQLKEPEIKQEQQDYRPVKELWQEYWELYRKTETERSLREYKEVEAMYKLMQQPPHKRKLASDSNVWEFHPQDITLMRKKTA